MSLLLYFIYSDEFASTTLHGFMLHVLYKDKRIIQWVEDNDAITAINFWRSLPQIGRCKIVKSSSKDAWMKDNLDNVPFLVDDFSQFWAAKLLSECSDYEAELHPRIDSLTRKLKRQVRQEQDEKQKRDSCADAAEKRFSSSIFSKLSLKAKLTKAKEKQSGEDKQVVRQMQKEIDDLTLSRNEIQADLMRERQQSLSRQTDSQYKLQTMQGKINDLLQVQAEIQDEVKQGKQIIVSLRSDREAKEEEAVRLQKEIHDLNASFSKIMDDLAREKQVSESTKQDLAVTNGKLQQVQVAGNNIHRQLIACQEQRIVDVNSLKDQIEQREATIARLEQEKEKAASRCIQAEESLMEATTLQSELQNEILHCKEAQKVLLQSVESAENELDAFAAAKNIEMEQLAMAKDLEIQLLQATNAQLIDEKTQIQFHAVSSEVEVDRRKDEKLLGNFPPPPQLEDIEAKMEEEGEKRIENFSSGAFNNELDGSKKTIPISPKAMKTNEAFTKSRDRRQNALGEKQKDKRMAKTAEKRGLMM